MTVSCSCADLERNLAQRDALGRAEDDALLLVGLEPLHGDGEVVRAGQQVGEEERAVSRR